MQLADTLASGTADTSESHQASVVVSEDETQAQHSTVSVLVTNQGTGPAPSVWVQLLPPAYWPLTVLLLVLIFRANIRNFLDELAEFRFGPWGAKRRRQGKTDPPPSSGEDSEPGPTAELKSESIELLSTLWFHQGQHFGHDPAAKRWTFRVSPASPRYAQYLAGLSECVSKGYVLVSPENLQCFLSPKGWRYCEANTNQLKGDFWDR